MLCSAWLGMMTNLFPPSIKTKTNEFKRVASSPVARGCKEKIQVRSADLNGPLGRATLRQAVLKPNDNLIAVMLVIMTQPRLL